MNLEDSEAGRQYLAAKRVPGLERDRAELVAALRKVTAELRSLMHSEIEGMDAERFVGQLRKAGVLEAEALLMRIEEVTS